MTTKKTRAESACKGEDGEEARRALDEAKGAAAEAANEARPTASPRLVDTGWLKAHFASVEVAAYAAGLEADEVAKWFCAEFGLPEPSMRALARLAKMRRYIGELEEQIAFDAQVVVDERALSKAMRLLPPEPSVGVEVDDVRDCVDRASKVGELTPVPHPASQAVRENRLMGLLRERFGERADSPSVVTAARDALRSWTSKGGRGHRATLNRQAAIARLARALGIPARGAEWRLADNAKRAAPRPKRFGWPKPKG